MVLRDTPGYQLAFALTALSFASYGCGGSCSSTPTPTVQAYVAFDTELRLVESSRQLRRTFVVHAATQAPSCKLVLQGAALPATETRVIDVSNLTGSFTRRFDSTEALDEEIELPGNVAVIAVDQSTSFPSPELASLSFLPPQGPQFPAVQTTPADIVKSVSLSLGQPVEVYFEPIQAEVPAFFTVQVPANVPVDLCVEGDVKVWLSNDETNFVLVDNTPDMGSLLIDSLSGGLVRLPTGGASGGAMLLTIFPGGRTTTRSTSPGPGEGPPRPLAQHVRVFAETPVDVFGLTWRFLGPAERFAPNQADLLARVARVARKVAQDLYQVTAGKCRLERCDVIIGVTSNLGVLADVQFADHDGGDDGLAITRYGPHRVVDVFWKLWDDGVDQALAEAITHELMHQRYNLPDEYGGNFFPAGPGTIFLPPVTTPFCPPSLMANQATDALCWSRNHTPTPDNPRTTISMWDILAPALGLPIPTVSPVRPLKAGPVAVARARMPGGFEERDDLFQMPMTVNLQ